LTQASGTGGFGSGTGLRVSISAIAVHCIEAAEDVG